MQQAEPMRVVPDRADGFCEPLTELLNLSVCFSSLLLGAEAYPLGDRSGVEVCGLPDALWLYFEHLTHYQPVS